MSSTAITSIEDLGAVEPGSVLVVTMPEYAEPPIFQAIKASIADRVGHDDFAIIGLAEPATLDLLTEDDMRRIGWVRAENGSNSEARP